MTACKGIRGSVTPQEQQRRYFSAEKEMQLVRSSGSFIKCYPRHYEIPGTCKTLGGTARLQVHVKLPLNNKADRKEDRSEERKHLEALFCARTGTSEALAASLRRRFNDDSIRPQSSCGNKPWVDRCLEEVSSEGKERQRLHVLVVKMHVNRTDKQSSGVGGGIVALLAETAEIGNAALGPRPRRRAFDLSAGSKGKRCATFDAMLGGAGRFCAGYPCCLPGTRTLAAAA